MVTKILILGGFGFIGTNLIEELLKRGNYEIIVFEAKKILIQNPRILNSIKIYYGDFHNENDYEVIFKENEIDNVIHLIGTTTPSLSNENIIYDIQSNIINSVKLLNMMNKYNIKNIVFPSSGGTVYGILKKEHKESDPTTPICSYGIIKLMIEKYLYLYNYLYGINFLIIRPYNPFVEYNKTLQQVFITIKDLVRIIVDLIEKKIRNEVINIGSGKGHSINEILSIIREEIGNFSLKYIEGRKVDVPHSVLNIDKLKTFLDINLKGINEAIKRTYEWLRK